MKIRNSTELEKVYWELKFPLNNRNQKEPLDWLIEANELRGYALYENGMRPTFKLWNNQYLDKDEFELSSYHLLANVKNKIVGCIRLLPLHKNCYCVTSEELGVEAFKMILKDFFIDTSNLVEINRWVVHPDYRGTSIGYYLVYGALALAGYLGYTCFGNGGLKMRKIIKHFGGTFFSNIPVPYYSKKYNDHIYLFYLDINKIEESGSNAIKEMARILNLKINSH